MVDSRIHCADECVADEFEMLTLQFTRNYKKSAKRSLNKSFRAGVFCVLDPVKKSIERCILKIREYYALSNEKTFGKDFLKQDAIRANLQRLCQPAIDLASITIRKKKLGLPKDGADSFEILLRNEN